MKMTMKQHFTMFSVIAETIRKSTNLDEEQATDFATRITENITHALNIDVEVSEDDEEFLITGLLSALMNELMN